jgi:hypothetical protein
VTAAVVIVVVDVIVDVIVVMVEKTDTIEWDDFNVKSKYIIANKTNAVNLYWTFCDKRSNRSLGLPVLPPPTLPVLRR